MKHRFKIDKSEKIWKLGEIDDNNNINGLGIQYNPNNKGFTIGEFRDGKPFGIYCSRLIVNKNKKTEECTCLETDPTDKHSGCFRMLIFDKYIKIYVYEDGNKQEKLPYRILIKENNWSISTKGSKNVDVMYMKTESFPEHKGLFCRHAPTKAAVEKNARRIEEVNLTPILWNFSIPNIPTEFQYVDKRKSLIARGFGPCFECGINWKQLYFVKRYGRDSLAWHETGKEHNGLVQLASYTKGEISGFVDIDKTTNKIIIHKKDITEFKETQIIIDPQLCTFEIKNYDYGRLDKAIVDKHAKVTYWSNCQPDDEEAFDFKETY